MNPKPESQPDLEGEEAPPFRELDLIEAKPRPEVAIQPKAKHQESRTGTVFSRSTLLGVAVGIGFGLFARLIFGSSSFSPIFEEMSFAFLVIMPLALGGLTTYVIRDKPYFYGLYIQATSITLFFFLLATIILNFEVFICILMAAPLIFPAGWVGALFMKWALRQIDGGRFGGKSKHYMLAILLAAPYFIAPIENMVQPQDAIRTVESRITIKAGADAIWPLVTRVAPISRAEHGETWATLFGMPYPLEASLSYDGLGGMRYASYDNGLRFMEEVFEWNPPHSFSFTIKLDPTATVSAPYSGIGGPYFNVIDAQYILEPQADGSTLVRLISRERVTTRFNGYATLWTDFLMNDLQDGILRVIRDRAEKTTIKVQ